VAGLRRRLVVPVPVLSPALSSLWVGLVTPVPAALAKPLVRPLVNEVVAAERPGLVGGTVCSTARRVAADGAAAAWWAVRPLLPAALPLVGRRLGRRAAAQGRPRDAAAVSRT
jgi:hypothetical protein